MKSVEDIYPLSPMQQGMLFHALYAPNSGAYVEQITCALDGELDLPSFREAWRRVLTLHPTLRTAFLWEGLDEPLQVVRQEVEIVSDYQDWRGLAPGEQRERLAAFLGQDREKGFELSRAPLTRYALLKTGEETHQFVWTFHHLILDGWSIPLVLRDFFASYEALCRGEEASLASPRPFRDYIEWLQQQELPEAMEFWRRTLGGFSSPTPLGIDKGSRELLDQGEATYEEARFKFSAETTARLQSFSRREKLTMNTLIQGAWALLLSRYSGRSDVVLGATVSGRSTQLAGANEMVGMFVNTLPVRARIEPGVKAVDWLRDFQAQLVEARQYEYSPLVQVHGWSEVPRGLPLFESIVSFQNHPVGETLRAADLGLKVHSLVVYHTRTTYPLTIVAEPDAELSLILVYDTRRFEPPVIARIAGHLETLLSGIASDPSQRVSGLPMLTASERLLLLRDFNRPDSPSALTPEDCLHRLFEREAADHPSRTALIAGGERLTYGELNERANRLAHYLRGMGVGPEVRVGLCLGRTSELVVAVLGVLKAGGAYVPLDPAYPVGRLALMVEDSAAPIILSERDHREKVESGGAKVICLDEDWPSVSACSAENPSPGAGPHNLMYVIYTSGSTGRPKGSLITHANAARLFDATDDWYGFGPSDVWTMFHSYAFDFSVWEMWGALCYGGRLVIVPERVSQSPEELHGLLQAEGVTVLNLTPSVFLQFLPFAVGETSKALGLRLVIFGGEALDLNSLRPWFQRYGYDTPRLVNMYGITETTVHVTYRPITADDYPVRTSSPVGVPLPDLQAYVLDAELQPVPMNVPGELYIGGAGLARGYLNMPGLTAERFMPNPFGAAAGDRLYRTGDRARLLEGMEIEYLGRVDNQVKIRGFRIELGEIEAALRQHERVRDVVVVPYEESAGDRRLSAYVVLNDDAAATTGEFRDYLGRRLPAYMLPSYFVFMDALPLVQNGKVDKRALPAPTAARPSMEQEYVAPRNELEEELAKIWCEVLGAERVGVYDNFFELGGHSLLAAQLISRVRDTFEVELPLRNLFEVSTIDGLAVAILHGQTEQASPDAIVEALAELEGLTRE